MLVYLDKKNPNKPKLLSPEPHEPLPQRAVWRKYLHLQFLSYEPISRTIEINAGGRTEGEFPYTRALPHRFSRTDKPPRGPGEGRNPHLGVSAQSSGSTQSREVVALPPHCHAARNNSK